MGKKDPRVDAYIEQSADFAKPILRHLRKVVHAGCPEVVETLKWSVPHFDHHGIMASMAAFKGHCTFGFWKGELLVDERDRRTGDDKAMGQFGRITSLSDLPSEKTLVQYVKKAAALNEQGIKRVAAPRAPKPPAKAPRDLVTALAANPRARTAFDSFSPSHRREYIEWITEAKTEATRERRIEQAVEMMSEGKSRNWKYERAK